jgi:hypothetical protein
MKPLLGIALKDNAVDLGDQVCDAEMGQNSQTMVAIDDNRTKLAVGSLQDG